MGIKKNWWDFDGNEKRITNRNNISLTKSPLAMQFNRGIYHPGKFGDFWLLTEEGLKFSDLGSKVYVELEPNWTIEYERSKWFIKSDEQYFVKMIENGKNILKIQNKREEFQEELSSVGHKAHISLLRDILFLSEGEFADF